LVHNDGERINLFILNLQTYECIHRVSCDFNAPNQDLCFQFLDKAILENGINLVDTAEQYPIPSDSSRPEGSVEEVIGKWINQDKKNRREKIVIATKITGGRVINRINIISHCDSSLRRLNTDYLDVYQLHWPARYTPQCNWGQSLRYDNDMEKYYAGAASFEEIVLAMSDLVKQGKIRGYGFCNDNAVGLVSCAEIAKRLNVPGPVSMQNDFSLIDRRQEENGVAEACSKVHQNVGFMSYNALAGGYLTGKYDNKPAYYDDPSLSSKQQTTKNPRGRHDEPGWSRTLYRYRSSAATSALKAYQKLAQEYNIPMTELALRWVKERRLVTTTLVGMSSMKQLEDNIDCYRTDKSLPPQLLWDIDRIHMVNRLPIFSSDRVGKDWFGEGEIGELIP
jgi:aryl-alcohol dehydrogenase-like predicted oxidoreductase